MESYYGLSENEIFDILLHFPNKIYFRDKNNQILFENGEGISYFSSSNNEQIPNNKVFHACVSAWESYKEAFMKQEKELYVIRMDFEGEEFTLINQKVWDDTKNEQYYLTIVQQNIKEVEFKLESLPNQNHPFILQNKSSTPLLSNTRSENMKKILHISGKIAKSHMPVLIQGESGTGKTLLAKYIHENSLRRKEPFLSINCAAIPKDLLESELFGYEPYAFTGADKKGKLGLFEIADKGTVFLDEIGELPFSLQSKILTFIETKTFLPIGAVKEKAVDVRILSATNRPLKKMIEEKQFREDLYWRLNHVPITLPKLTDRTEDILPLANYFINQYNQKSNSNIDIDLSAQSFLYQYSWPGNIRELKNVLESVLVCCNGQCIKREDLEKTVLSAKKNNNEKVSVDFKNEMEYRERELIKEYYKKYSSSRKLASALQISQSLANKLIQKYIE